MQTRLLINGKLVAGEGKVEEVLNPATGKVLAKVPEASRGADRRGREGGRRGVRRLGAHGAEGSRDAAAQARGSHRGGRRGVREARVAELRQAATPRRSNDEIPAIADVFRFFAGACRTMTGAVAGEYLAGFTSMIRRDPIGVVASIAPWNYPLMMAAWKLGPALAAGNTCVLKPSEQTPLTALKLGELLAEIFPAGVVNVVCGRGAVGGRAAHEAPEGAHDLAHRRRRDGREDPRPGERRHQAHAPRARRQGAGDRVRRRGRRVGRVRACAPSATTTRARTARPPAASTRARRSTTGWSPTCRRP